MTVEQYLGLFKFVLGMVIFFAMAWGFRAFAKRSDKNKKTLLVSPPWYTWEELVIINNINETSNIKTFVFERKNNFVMPAFEPGQFLSFQIANDAKVVRSYSISSSPNNKKNIHIAVKLLDGGVGSSWFHQKKIGDTVMAMPPSGHFVDDQRGKEQRVYIAGGVGITPILSMIKKNAESQVKFPMILFYGVRTESDLAFHKELKNLSENFKNFRYLWFLSEGPTAQQKILNFKSIQQTIPDFDKAKFYLCGPAPMTDGLISELINAKVDEDNIFNEKFISPTALQPEDIPIRQVNVKYSGKTFKYNGRDNLLSFLESQGESLPYSCRTGVCGTCVCKIKGSYKTLTDAGLTRQEKKEGFTLSCVSYPTEDIEVEV